jgi:enoyl-CoA hydratase/carnithine racemase
VGEFVTVTTDEHGVATLRLDRPKVNALNQQLWTELADAADEVTEDDAVGAVVIWGGPKVFAAGADIKAMVEMTSRTFYAHMGGLQEAFRKLAHDAEGHDRRDQRLRARRRLRARPDRRLPLRRRGRPARPARDPARRDPRRRRHPAPHPPRRHPEGQGDGLRGQLLQGADEPGDGPGRQGLPRRGGLRPRRRGRPRFAAGPYALRMAKQAIDQGIEMDLDSALRLETTLFAACFATEDRPDRHAVFLEHGPG